ncbi:molybdopterin dinucleotide binding domain-containing protein, partial [Ornithinicoccus halotolerans]|uniref:molybdopterin dinucleotide binding domain-containing protein n=1 Tax=Ornithinicoccus halotolerans TaxID=1748220 RepID=UPI00129730B3
GVGVAARDQVLGHGQVLEDVPALHALARAWGTGLPVEPGRDTGAMLAAAARGELSALVVAGVDPDDLPDPATARAGLERAFVVSLEIRESPVHEYADVILPVAPQQEKPGTFLDWEGRERRFDQALGTELHSDHVVLDRLAAAMGSPLDTGSYVRVRQQLAEIGRWDGRQPAPQAEPAEPARPGPGEAVLATWHHLLDEGSLQDGEPFLAGTAPRTVARLSAVTAQSAGVAEGDPVTVSTAAGSITLPAQLTKDMPDHVVWLPTNSPGSAVRATLGVDAGAVVQLRAGATGGEE